MVHAKGETYMILDPTNQFIINITAHRDLGGRDILEIGCGSGRITRDLAPLAQKVVAIDPDERALQMARAAIAVGNVEFVCCGGESLPFAENSFDLIIYSLSLHHLPVDSMETSLKHATRLLRGGGTIIVIEPGSEGTLIEAEERFGVGDGDEGAAKEEAQRAMRSLEGWNIGETVWFQTFFYFTDETDFLENLLPEYRNKPEALIGEIGSFLHAHKEDGRIVLSASRRMNLLTAIAPL
jgi:ubiquinone/menaquinone biosynthesis C-methylase UbiE